MEKVAILFKRRKIVRSKVKRFKEGLKEKPKGLIIKGLLGNSLLEDNLSSRVHMNNPYG